MTKRQRARGALVLAAGLGLIGPARPATAGSTASGYVNEIVVYPSGAALINIAGQYVGAPACNIFVGHGYNRFTLELQTPAGRAVYATLTLALQAKSPVMLSGTGECIGGGETIAGAFLWPAP